MAHSKQSRKTLSEAIGQSVQSIGMVINGKNKQLSTRASAKAAAFMGVDHDWLVSGEGSMLLAQTTPPTASLSYDAQHLGRWLDKITDPELRYRTAHAAMAEVLSVLDGPPNPPTPGPAAETRTRPVSRSKS